MEYRNCGIGMELSKVDRLLNLEQSKHVDGSWALSDKDEVEYQLLLSKIRDDEIIVGRLQKELADEEKTFRQMGELLKKCMDDGNISGGNLIFDQLESHYRDIKKLRETLKLPVKPIIEEIKHGTN